MVENVAILKNIGIYNAHHDRTYSSDNGVIIIEINKQKRIILDLDSMNDITDSDYLKIVINKKRTKIKYLFKNIMFDTEKIERLSNGK